jgi:sporulation protein YlmC with PRC-barrel domain
MKTRIAFGVLVSVALVGVWCDAQVRPAAKERVVEEKAVEGKSAATTRASDLMGMEVVLEKGDTVGTIKDLVMDNQTGHVQYVVVATDEGDYRAIPWKTLALYQGDNAKDRYFILGMEQNRFNKAPAIPQKEWQTFSPNTWTEYVPQVNQYYSDVRPVRAAAVRRAERRR